MLADIKKKQQKTTYLANRMRMCFLGVLCKFLIGSRSRIINKMLFVLTLFSQNYSDDLIANSTNRPTNQPANQPTYLPSFWLF